MARVTINDIARESGVSKTAVSFAFNDPSQLAPATVQHIREVAERLGYMPDPVARSMTTKRTNAIGLLLPHDIATAFENPFYTALIRGVGQICGEAGKTLMLVPPLWGSRLKAIPHAAVDGFLVIGLELERDEIKLMQRRNMPFVIIDSEAPERVLSVNVDDRSGARAAMCHVLEHGHTDIAIVCIQSGKHGPDEYTGTLAQRFLGYQEALRNHGFASNDSRVQVVETPSTWAGGNEVFGRLWESAKRPTAIVAMSDIIAIGILDAAIAEGVQLPEQLSVVGFDDLPDAQHAPVPLTTVQQPVQEKGRLATELLVQAINGDSTEFHHLLPTKLIVRESVARQG